MRKLLLIVLFVVALVGCDMPYKSELLVTLEKTTEWQPDGTYSKGDYCLESKVVYCSLRDENKGNDPALSPGWWTAE